MTRDLDDLLATLAHTPVDSPMATFEAEVWERVDRLQSKRIATQFRFGAIAVALVAGLTTGAFGAVAAPPTPGEMAIFSVDAALSPLARLETGR